MKKFNITSEKLATIAFTCIVWLCVLIAAAFALDITTNDVYFNAGGTMLYLILAGVCEWVKYKITHNNNNYGKES